MSVYSRLKSLSRTRRAQRKSLGDVSTRRAFFERLEDRQLMAADWQNPGVPTDVNDDRVVAPLDALRIINQLNSGGGGALPALAPGQRPSGYFDTNGDQALSPLDALKVINALNADRSGNQLTQIASLSSHYVQATFELPVSDALLFPEAYVLTGPGSQSLEVVKVARGNAPNQLILTTTYQANANYAVQLNPAVTATQAGSKTFAGLAHGPIYGPADLVKPRLIDLVPANSTTFLATYDRPMGASAIDPANYKITGEDGNVVEVLNAQFAEGESVVQLQTAPQSSTSFTVNLQNVADRNGQTVFFEGRKITGNPKGAVVSAAATSSNRAVVVFNEPMADNALAPQHYALRDPSGKALLVTDVRFDGPLGMVVILTTAAQSNVNYSLTVSNVTDLQNDGMQVSSTSFQGIAGLPNLVGANPAGPNTILLSYNLAMSDDVLTPSAYSIKNSVNATLPVLSAQFLGSERRLVQLTTGPQSAGSYTIQSITANDANGNPVTIPGTTGSFQGAPAPSLLTAIPTDPTHVFLTFGVPLGDSALSPSSYRLQKINPQGIVIDTLPVSAPTFVGSQRSVVSLTTPYQSDARYRLTTTSGLKDATDSPLAVVALDFQGIGTTPKVVSTSSTGPTGMLVTFSVPMSDSAALPASYVVKDSTGTSVTVTHATFVGDDRRVVQLTTGPQIAGSYTLQSITATDLGGSAVAAPGTAGVFQGAPAPNLASVSPSDTTHLVVTFTGSVSDSALTPSSYLLEELNAQRAVVRTIPVEAAQFIGSQQTVVSLKTPYLAQGSYRLASTSALTDTTGTSLAVFAVEFQGLGLPSSLLGATSTSPNTILLVTSAPMSDDVLAPSAYAIRTSTAATLPVVGAEFVGTERRVIQLTTGTQSAEPYAILSIAAKDLEGNSLVVPGTSGTFHGAPEPKLLKTIPTDPSHLVLTFGSPLGDSAMAPSSYQIDVLNAQGDTVGSLPITAAAFLGTQKTVVSLTTPYQAGGRYRLSTTDSLSDASGAPLAVVEQEFRGMASASKLVAVSSTSPNTLQAIFNVAMSDDALATASYSISDAQGAALPILSARFVGTERRIVELTTASQASGQYSVESLTIHDIDGSPVSIQGSSISFQGSRTSSLSSAAPVDSTHVVLTFDGPVGDSALAPSSYRIEKLNAAGNVTGSLTVNSVEFIGNQRRVVSLTTLYQPSGRYRITTHASLRDVTGVALPVEQLEFQGLGNLAKLVSTTSTGPTTMLLTFNVAMSDDVLTPSSYIIQDTAGANLSITMARFLGTERRVVQLTTAPQSAGIYTIQSISATDSSGNSVSTIGTPGVFLGIDAPSLNHATATDPNHIYLTFAGPVGDSALSPSSYRIDKLDTQGAVIGQLVVSSSAFIGEQRTVVALTTTSQSEGSYRLSTTSSLTDVSGSPVPVSQFVFEGVGSQARLVAVSSTSFTTLVVTFSMPMSDDALSPSLYVIEDGDGARLPVINVQFLGTERRLVQLTTGPMTAPSYTVTSIQATDVGGSTTIIPPSTTINTFDGYVFTGSSTHPVEGAPRVVGAASLSNTSVLVAFNEPMADNALNTSHYFIVQQNVNAEVGYVPIVSAVFNTLDRRSVLLTTASQNELTYAITALNVTDLAGNALASAIIAGATRVDPTTAQFPGTPPSGTQIVDTDGDGLSDHVEVRGWTVTVTLLNGSTVTREVTSDPNNPDTDGDLLGDAQELNIGIDPRSKDTDGDQLSDWAEFNEIYSDPTNQDSDGDSLDDFLEFAFFKTSPYLADTDGDQLSDDYEIFGNRNPRVSDLPRPEIDVGSINLQLDVRFNESNARESRALETRSVNSTLTQSASKTYTHQHTANVQAHLEGGVYVDLDDGSWKAGAHGGASAGYTFQQTEESSQETTQAYEKSFETEKEVSSGFTVDREVVGAQMQVAVNLRNVSTLAFRVKNLQVTAFIQDPQDRTRLTPIATLVPDHEPEEGFTLGPLVTNRGPLIFSNSAIIPSLVESLMANSSGLIFRISNYDVINEDGRNFAFVSQEVVERTAGLVIDFGGARSLRARVSDTPIDENQPGEETEIHRVATSAGRVIGADQRVIFDANGKEVGITLYEALSAIGLTRYEARGPVDSTTGFYPEFEVGAEVDASPVDLANDEMQSSYSTFIDEEGREKIYRVRGIANNEIIKKNWEILTPLGVDHVTSLTNLVLKTSLPASLNYVQDLDEDGLPADVEYFLRTSDSPLPFGAVVPGSTDLAAHSVRFNTDPGLATGSLARVTETATGGGLVAGENYYVRRLSDSTYSFYHSMADAASDTGRIPLSKEIRAGIFSPNVPSTTNQTANSISFDPAFATGASVQVLAPGGSGLVPGTYYVRNLGGASYSFYTTAAHAQNVGSEDGRVRITGYITTGIRAGTSGPIFNPVSTDFASQSVSFDPAYATGTVVNVTASGAGLSAAQPYFFRNLGGGVYGFHTTVADAITGTATVDLTESITSGIFSPTAKGRDTDRDGLDDRFETLIGWTVSTPLRTATVYSSPNRRDSNFDHPKLGVDSDSDGVLDRAEYDGSDLFAAPAGWNDKNQNGLRDPFEVFQLNAEDFVLDPIRKDTDEDGIPDATEIIGFRIVRIEDGSRPLIDHTDPNTPFTDSDTFTDGFEKAVGLDPTDGRDTDEDGDGLPDQVEFLGWYVYVFGVSTAPFQQGAYALGYGGQNVAITPQSTNTGTNIVTLNSVTSPNLQQATLVQVTGGGLAAGSPYYLGRLREQGSSSTQYRLYEAAVDAIAGTATGALDLTSSIADLLVMARKVSSTQSVDSDEDGLTDYEEFFLRTDAASKDTDNDGIEDRVEQLGYALGHKVGSEDLGIIQTNPLDADTDNDLRSDGAEAELKDVELARWVVRAVATTRSSGGDSGGSSDISTTAAYRVYSNPLVADADYDGLVDGEEYGDFNGDYQLDPKDFYKADGRSDVGLYRTDPNNANTDGDSRNDGTEILGGTNPLADDLRVTVVIDSIEVSNFNDEYDISVVARLPGNSFAGLSAETTHIISDENDYERVGRVWVQNRRQSNHGSTVRVFYDWKDAHGTVHRTPSEPDITQDGGVRIYDPNMGGRGVPLGAQFRVGFEIVYFADKRVSPHWYTYTGNETAALAYQLALDGPDFRVWDGRTGNRGEEVTASVRPRLAPAEGFEYIDFSKHYPIASRAISFGMTNFDRFSVEAIVVQRTSLGESETVNFGGLSGERAMQDKFSETITEPTKLRPVFARKDIESQFIEDFYFRKTLANGAIVTIRFYYIVG